MRKIKPKNVKVGELVYLVGIKHKDTRYILQILNVWENKLKVKILYLAVEGKKQKLAELKLNDIFPLGGIACNIKILPIEIYRLNKKEVSEFNKLRIIKNL